MEKETLIQGFKERLGGNASVVSDRSYEEIANVALPSFADDSKITDDTWKLPVQMLNTLAGQYRHDVADGIAKGKTQWATENDVANKKIVDEQVAAFKAQWEKGHPSPERNGGDNIPAQTDEDKRKAEMTELVKSILAESNKQLLADDGAIGKLSKSMNGFMETYNKQQRETLVSGLQKQVKSYLTDELHADSTPSVNLAIKQLEIGENPDIDALKLQAKKNYETVYKEFYGNGGQPYGGKGTGSQTGSGLVDDYIKNKATQATKEAQDAEALRKTFK